MSNDAVKRILWWVCLSAAPLVLVGIELFHPAGFTEDPGMYQYLSVPEPYTPRHHALGYFGPAWWFTLHMIQTLMIGLVAVGLWLMLDGIDRKDGAGAMVSGWTSRAATFVFVIYYTALDSIGGVGLGKTIEITERLGKAAADQAHLTPDQVAGVALVLNTVWTDPWIGGVGSFISQTGSWAAFSAALFAALALFLAKKAPWPPLVILGAFGWELQLSHASYYGPIAFSLLVISAAWIWLAAKRRPA